MRHVRPYTARRRRRLALTLSQNHAQHVYQNEYAISPRHGEMSVSTDRMHTLEWQERRTERVDSTTDRPTDRPPVWLDRSESEIKVPILWLRLVERAKRIYVELKHRHIGDSELECKWKMCTLWLGLWRWRASLPALMGDTHVAPRCM